MTGRTIGSRLSRAQARADAARARLSGSISALQHRTSPQVIAKDVTDSIKERGVDAVLGAVDTARRHPAQVGSALALAGLFLARGPIFRAITRSRKAPPSKTDTGSKS